MGGRGGSLVSLDVGTMARSWGSYLLLLTILVALVASTDPGKNNVKVLRELKVINASNANVKQCLWFAMQEYNKESEDKYLFQVVKTVQVQLQVKVFPPTMHVCLWWHRVKSD